MLKVKGSTQPRVRDTGPTQPRVEGAAVAAALGAEPTGVASPKPQGPVALLALRQGLAARLQSTGGRPGLGESRRQKIPLSDEDWALLGEIADQLADAEHHPTAGQVASELLHQRLQEIHKHLVQGGSRRRAGAR